MTLSKERLDELDKHGYAVIDALHHAKGPAIGSHANPHAFVCISGQTYWVKAQAQQGLAAELIAGRLAGRVGSGPTAHVIRVSNEALPGGAFGHLEGVVVGSLDQPNWVNPREIQAVAPNVQLDDQKIDPASRARVVAFQTWIGVSDQQVLLDLTNGEVASIDHGDCFGMLDPASPASPVVADIPGVSMTHGSSKKYLDPALDGIEGMSDEVILQCVAQVPTGANWNSAPDRRFAIAEFLAARRHTVRKVMASWR